MARLRILTGSERFAAWVLTSLLIFISLTTVSKERGSLKFVDPTNPFHINTSKYKNFSSNAKNIPSKFEELENNLTKGSVFSKKEIIKINNITNNTDELIEALILMIAYPLRSHKFHLEDPHTYKLKTPRLHVTFPYPAPSEDSMVKSNCKKGFINCIRFLAAKLNTQSIDIKYDLETLKHSKHFCSNQSFDALCIDKYYFINKTTKEYQLKQKYTSPAKLCSNIKKTEKLMKIATEVNYEFIYTSLLYMCWYTLQKNPFLKYMTNCDSTFSCTNEKSSIPDYRASAGVPFACAMHSFCPDPCCNMMNPYSKFECQNKQTNPCYFNKIDKSCEIDLSNNFELKHLKYNLVNVTCKCNYANEKFNQLARMCKDIDECETESHNCDPITEECENIKPGFLCICKWGFLWDDVKKKCIKPNVI